MNQKYIITGAPGTGKTSIINELKKRGFNCIDEISRDIIAEQSINNQKSLPWKNQIAFETKIANMRSKKYLTSPENCICFFDRSALDCIAYLELNNLKPTSEIIAKINICNFNKKAFYTPIWEEIYVKDNERKEDIKRAKEIHEKIISIYKKKGYKLIRVPKLSITERANFIISEI